MEDCLLLITIVISGFIVVFYSFQFIFHFNLSTKLSIKQAHASMDGFLKSLSLSSITTVKDVTYDCMKILDWVYKTSLCTNRFTYKDIENIGKGMVFLNNCFILFEDELPNRLLEQYPFLEKLVNTFFGNASNYRLKSIAHIFESVAQTQDGLEHIFPLESILNAVNESNDEPIALEYSLTGVAKETTSVLKMHTLVQKIFQLPRDQVDIAIDQSLHHIPFSIIGLVFCEPKSSFYIDAYFILAHKIYEKLIHGSISTFFIKSLYQYASIFPNGKRFYWQCLKNKNFVNGMSSLFIRTLRHISNNDYVFNIDIGQVIFEEHRLSHVLYLNWAALSHLSPCHIELYKRIMNVGLSKCLLIFNKIDRVYE